MSWKDAARKALEHVGAVVEEDERGLIASPGGGGGPSVRFVVRRLHMSLDRKVEAIGVVEVLPRGQGAPEVLRKMLASSFEVEMRGLLRRRPVWRSWRELRRLEALAGPLVPDTSLMDSLRGDSALEKALLAASPDMLEVFPEIMPQSYMEAFLLAPGAPLTPFVVGLVRSYLASPERLAWCFRAQFVYGYPRMPQKIAKNYLMALELGRALREHWLKPSRCTSSSPQEAESST